MNQLDPQNRFSFQMSKVMWPFKNSLLGLFLFFMGIMDFAAASDFQQRVDKNQLLPTSSSSTLELTFFGTSSFLLDDGKTQILIDGFFTRKKHGLLRKFPPSEPQILTAMKNNGICKSMRRKLGTSPALKCPARSSKKLAFIIPTHGHYDHAMDAPYVAAWSGATLVGDQTVKAILDASKAFNGFTDPDLNWDGFKMVSPFYDDPNLPVRSLKKQGNFQITLIRTAHNINPSSLILNRKKTPKFSFPSNIWKMKQGVTFSVLIEHQNKRMLFIPSAGVINNEFKSEEFTADVVFLGIGGLGFKSPIKRTNFWKNTVSAVQAKRVVPIHWDDVQISEKPKNGTNFKVAKFRRFSATMKVFDKLALKCGIDIAFAPPAIAFNPFQLLENRPTSERIPIDCQ